MWNEGVVSDACVDHLLWDQLGWREEDIPESRHMHNQGLLAYSLYILAGLDLGAPSELPEWQARDTLGGLNDAFVSEMMRIGTVAGYDDTAGLIFDIVVSMIEEVNSINGGPEEDYIPELMGITPDDDTVFVNNMLPDTSFTLPILVHEALHRWLMSGHVLCYWLDHPDVPAGYQGEPDDPTHCCDEDDTQVHGMTMAFESLVHQEMSDDPALMTAWYFNEGAHRAWPPKDMNSPYDPDNPFWEQFKGDWRPD